VEDSNPPNHGSRISREGRSDGNPLEVLSVNLRGKTSPRDRS
jgi:hypothetical protein